MKIMAACACLAFTTAASAQTEVLMKFGNFDQWLTRNVKESGILGGNTKQLYEVAPTATWNENKAYTNQGGSIWANSNVMAKVAGVTKTNTSVYPAQRGSGKCAKLYTHEETCKALGIVNISVIAAGSLFTGNMVEPITSTSNPYQKLNLGIAINEHNLGSHWNQHLDAVKFEYKVVLSNEPVVKETGFSKKTKVKGKDYPQATVVLQKRWEDAKGNIHAKRVATAMKRFTQSTDWKTCTLTLQYGNISTRGDFQSFEGLFKGDFATYATNSKGKQVKVIEEWGTANDKPTHIIVKFDSSCGGAFIGAPGNTLYVDNVKLVY